MALASEAARRFTVKFQSLINKDVIVRTTTGKTYTGKLYGFDQTSMSVILVKVRDSDGKNWPLVIVSGNVLAEILLTEEAVFDAEEFSTFLTSRGIPPHYIRVYRDLNVVEVSKNIRVSKNGVEGSGPMAQKIRTLYLEYLRSKGVEV